MLLVWDYLSLDASWARGLEGVDRFCNMSLENLFATHSPIVTLWVFGSGSVRVLPAGRFATDNRLTELTIEPKLILPSRDALE